VKIQAKLGPKWNQEDLQRVLFHIVDMYTHEAKQFGGMSEFMNHAIYKVGRQTLIDNGWWDKDYDMNIPKVRNRISLWGRIYYLFTGKL